MKKLSAALLCVVLAGCAGSGPGFTPANEGVGVSVPQLSTAISILTGDVDVKVTVKNEYSLPLKAVRVYLVSYDHDGKLIRGTVGTLEVTGPIARGESKGPLEIKSVMQSRDVRCVEVARIEAVRMDYVTLYATGQEANQLVSGGSRRACASGPAS